MSENKKHPCEEHEFCTPITLCRDADTMRKQRDAHDVKMEAEPQRKIEANDEYVFGPPGRDTLWDLCEQIYDLGRTLIDAANNAERVENLRALEQLTNTLGFDCLDYLMDLGATQVDDRGETFDAIVLPIKSKSDI